MKAIILAMIFFWGSLAFAGRQVQHVVLLDDVTATGASASYVPFGVKRSFQAEGETSSGAGSATIDIEVSNQFDKASGTCSNWITMGTITLTLSTSTSTDGFVSDAAWKCVRANLSAVSGTGASVSVYMGQQLL